jgi:hypothetical protein
MRKTIILLFGVAFFNLLSAQPFTPQDTLRGSITPERSWWDLSFYDLKIDFDIEHKMIKGSNAITFHVLKAAQTMQIDLQEPLKITKVDYHGKLATFNREGNVYWVHLPSPTGPELLIKLLSIMKGLLLRLSDHRGMVASPGQKMKKEIPLSPLPARDWEPVYGGHARITCMMK